MDYDYFSIDAILAENQVGALLTRKIAAIYDLVENTMHLQDRCPPNGASRWRF